MNMVLQRLEQILRHLKSERPSLLHGPTASPLLTITLSRLLQDASIADPDRDCIVFPKKKSRITYRELFLSSKKLAKGLLSLGLRNGDHVGILAGNCAEYVELLFACSHVGAALVVFNNTYTAPELKTGLKSANCQAFFISARIGKQTNERSLEMLQFGLGSEDLPDLKHVILINSGDCGTPATFQSYCDILSEGQIYSDAFVEDCMRRVLPEDVCNLQFTSGTTGNPKASLLTHNSIINNGKFIGDRMSLEPEDRICCPPPLFHCFGLVLGLLAVITHGATIIFPSETFDPTATLEAVRKERCTGLHGVPTMFALELEQLHSDSLPPILRTGIAAGAPVPLKLMQELRIKMGLHELTNTYGMTETSPASFMTCTDDPLEKRLSTVGRIMPHTSAKIIDCDGHIVPFGRRGELCIAGYLLQKGYWRNPEKTSEAMRSDEQGVLWMHTGDEAMFDQDNFCCITGRIKDIIIRGGENIYPVEVEERLMQHPAVSQASVVGLPDERYGESVAAFLKRRPQENMPLDKILQSFINEKLGCHKVPTRIIWLAEGEDFPQTGSGKIKKHVLRERGLGLIKREIERRS